MSEEDKIDTAQSTYRGRKIEAQADSTGNTTLSCTVRAENHVEIRTRGELDVIISDEVAQLNTDDGSRNVAATGEA